MSDRDTGFEAAASGVVAVLFRGLLDTLDSVLTELERDHPDVARTGVVEAVAQVTELQARVQDTNFDQHVDEALAVVDPPVTLHSV